MLWEAGQLSTRKKTATTVQPETCILMSWCDVENSGNYILQKSSSNYLCFNFENIHKILVVSKAMFDQSVLSDRK